MDAVTYSFKDIPGIEKPQDRIRFLCWRIEKKDGEEIFWLTDGFSMPLSSIVIDRDGRVGYEPRQGAWRLREHMEWLERQPNPTGIASCDEPLVRYRHLGVRFSGSFDAREFDINGHGKRVPASQVWIDREGRVSTQRFTASWPLFDHMKWLEGKRSVAKYLKELEVSRRRQAQGELQKLLEAHVAASRGNSIRTREPIPHLA